MFKLLKKDVELSTLTTRTENHGDDHVPAVTLKCIVTLPNTALDMFDSKLLPALYENREKAQAELIKSDILPDLKFARIKPISWEEEYDDCRFILVNPLSPDEAKFIIPDCTIKGFKFELKDGGSVEVTFSIACNPEPDAVAYLYKQQRHNILITIEPPEEVEIDELAESLGAF